MATYTNPTQQYMATLSDADLDMVWYANVQAGQTQTAALAAQIIVDRLSSVGGFFQNLVGVTRFPQYEAATKFSGAAASSVATSAGNVATTIKETAQQVAGFTASTLVLLVIAVGGVIYLTKKGK